MKKFEKSSTVEIDNITRDGLQILARIIVNVTAEKSKTDALDPEDIHVLRKGVNREGDAA